MTKQLYDLANIRALLINGFNDRDLRRLCYEVPDFRPVYDRLARGTGKEDIIDELLEYAEKTVRLDFLLKKAKERNPTQYEEHQPYHLSSSALYSLGKACYDKGDYKGAITYFSGAIRLEPDHARAYFKRGDARDEVGDHDQAVVDYTKAIELGYQPLNRAFLYRGVANKKGGQYDRAIADFSEAIRLLPTYALAYGNRGSAYNSKGDYDRAISDCNEAIRLEPGEARHYNQRGYAHQMKGNKEQAIADFKQAARLAVNDLGVRGYAESRLQTLEESSLLVTIKEAEMKGKTSHTDEIPGGIWRCTYWSGGEDYEHDTIRVAHKTKDIVEIEGSWWWAYVAREESSKVYKGFWQPSRGNEQRWNWANPAEATYENSVLKLRWNARERGKFVQGAYGLYKLEKAL